MKKTTTVSLKPGLKSNSLVSLINGISTFVEYLSSLNKNSRLENIGVNTFPKGIRPKVDLIAPLEFELGYFEDASQPFCHGKYPMDTAIHLNFLFNSHYSN